MDRYDVKEQIGEGTFGTVFRAIHKQSGEQVRQTQTTLMEFG